jgi:erythromycin esterase-like protein
MLSTEALANFERFPTWMWRNTVVADFAGWLREYNAALPPGTPQTGFYGMDLYSLYQSIKAVVGYLEKIDPEAAKRARSRYACFEHAGEDPQAYGYAASFDVTDSCRDEVVAQLVELQRHFGDYASRDGRVAEDEAFYAEQNARLAKNAEEYYRSMFAGRVSSWNLRDCHMAETLDELLNFLDKQNGGKTRMVVWAHNSHLGDARATQMGRMSELNVGQVVRQRYDREAVLIGFTTYTGTVTAASDWDEPAERKRVRPGLPGSYESLFHEAGGNFWLNLRDTTELRQTLGEEWLERAIGVIYRPDTERISHYFKANLPRQFDAIIHLDETRALEPLEPTTGWHAGEEVPETYPTAL